MYGELLLWDGLENFLMDGTIPLSGRAKQTRRAPHLHRCAQREQRTHWRGCAGLLPSLFRPTPNVALRHIVAQRRGHSRLRVDEDGYCQRKGPKLCQSMDAPNLTEVCEIGNNVNVHTYSHHRAPRGAPRRAASGHTCPAGRWESQAWARRTRTQRVPLRSAATTGSGVSSDSESAKD